MPLEASLISCSGHIQLGREDPGHAGESLSLAWDRPRILENLEEVDEEKCVCASILKLNESEPKLWVTMDTSPSH